MTPTLVTGPVVNPVSLNEAKQHIRVDFSDDDAVIDGCIRAATSHLDGYAGILGRAIMAQTWSVALAFFPPAIRIPLGDLMSVESVKYFDPDGVEQTVDPATYYVGKDARGPYIVLKDGETWPDTAVRYDAVTVTWIAGYGSEPIDVPDAVRHAIKMLAAHFYDERGSVVIGTIVEELPLGVRALTLPHQVR